MQRTLLVAVMLALVASANAQDRATRPADAIPPVQAPPKLDDPGTAVTLPSPQAEAAKAVSENPSVNPAANSSSIPNPADKALPETQPLPPDVQAAVEASELPVITVRAQGADTVEEYRNHGKLYFVRVLSSSGPPKFYVDNPQAVPGNIMQQMSGPSGVVTPVYYKLADWK